MQASYIMSIFMISVVMFDLRKALPIDESNIKLIVDGEHNEIITEHEVGFVTGKPMLDRFDVPEPGIHLLDVPEPGIRLPNVPEPGIHLPDPIETSESKHIRRRIHRLNSRLGFPLFRQNTGFPLLSFMAPLLGSFFG